MDIFVATGNTVGFTPGTANQSVQIPLPSPAVNYRPTIRIRNTSAVEVFIRFDSVAPTANAATDMPIAPNSVETIGVPQLPSQVASAPFATVYVAGIAASAGASEIYFTPGLGL